MSCQYVAEWRPAGSDQATVATLMRPPTVTLPSVIRSIWRHKYLSYSLPACAFREAKITK